MFDLAVPHNFHHLCATNQPLVIVDRVLHEKIGVQLARVDHQELAGEVPPPTTLLNIFKLFDAHSHEVIEQRLAFEDGHIQGRFPDYAVKLFDLVPDFTFLYILDRFLALVLLH